MRRLCAMLAQRGAVHMMLLIFAALLCAFVLAWYGRARWAIRVFAGAFVLATGLFLWEVYSPTYGFAMPWIQVERLRAVGDGPVVLALLIPDAAPVVP